MRIIDEAASAPILRAVSVPEDPITLPDDEAFAAHMARRRYGDFTLTDAIRPGWRLDVVPRVGYRHDAWSDPHGASRIHLLRQPSQPRGRQLPSLCREPDA